MTKRAVIVSLTDDALADLSTVVDALRRAGLTVADTLPAAGVVTGTADGSALAGLSAVPGVTDVEAERTVRHPPPDSPVQ